MGAHVLDRCAGDRRRLDRHDVEAWSTMSDEPRPERWTEPNDRLGRLAAVMISALEADPEYRDETAVVMLTNDTRCLTALSGYTDDTTAMADMFIHLRAIVRASGRDLEIIGVPDDASGLDS